MRKRFSKNSKKGLTLPVAIVISIVLVIIAAGLVFIALQSISTTSVTVNGRQAFMDVRSALEYVESYYRNKVSDYSMIGEGTGIEYFSAEETEASDHTAEIRYLKSSAKPDPNNVKTYVVAEYISGTPSNLKLTGYSHYADEFGNSGKSVSLSVTFTVGSSGSQKRVTVINLPKTHDINSSSDNIKLNFRKAADLTDWADVCYYIWTFQDKGGAYSGANGLNYYDASGNKIKPEVSKMNQNEIDDGNHKVEPNGVWFPDNPDGSHGANGTMVKQSNGWYLGEYKIDKSLVNYFNLIFAKKGAVLEQGLYDTQSSEIFHLWYLNPDDKNIYFEMINKKKYDSGKPEGYYFKYYSAQAETVDWNGREYLDDTILVYLKNQKTTVHFRAIDDNDNKLTSVLGANVKPVITSVANSDGKAFTGPTFLTSGGKNVECSGSKQRSGIEMVYEGCGWWVANVETKNTFNIRISYRGVEYSLNSVRPQTDSSAPDATPESWIVLKKRMTAENASEKYLEAHQTEEVALKALGVTGMPYVTVHAKNYDPDQTTSPKLTYTYKMDSSVKRQQLREKIIEASMLVASDYSNYDEEVKENLTKSMEAYAWQYFMQAPYKITETQPPKPASGTQVDMEKVENAYQTYIDAIDAGIAALTPAYADRITVSNFIKAYEEAKEIEDHSELYDYKAYLSFVSPSGTYKSSAAMYANVKNQSNVTEKKSEVETQTKALREKIDGTVGTDGKITGGMKNSKLDRQPLKELVENTKKEGWMSNKKYQESYRTALTTAFPDIEDLTNPEKTKEVYQNYDGDEAHSLYHQEQRLRQLVKDIQDHPEVNNSLDFSKLDQIIQNVSSTMTAAETSDKDYTDESWNNLSKAKEDALNLKKNSEAKQEDVTSMETTLQKALNNFKVIKPTSDGTAAIASDKVRLWFPVAHDGYENSIKKLKSDGTVSEDVSKWIKTDAASAAGLEYIDLTVTGDNATQAVRFAVKDKSAATELAVLESISIDELMESNTYLDVNYNTKAVTVKKFTTLFIPKSNSEGKLYEELSMKIGNDQYGEGNRTTTKDYYVYRYPSDPNASIVISDKVVGGQSYTAHSTATIPDAKKYVISLNEFELKPVNVDDIHPKAVQNGSGDNNGNQGSNISTSAVPSYTIGNMVAKDDDYAAVKVTKGNQISETAKNQIIDAIKAKEPNMGSNKMCIVVHKYKNDDHYDGVAPRIWMWGGGKNNASEWSKRPTMSLLLESDADGRSSYYYICDKTFENYKTTKNDETVVMNNSSLSKDYGKMYDYYIIQEYDNVGDEQAKGYLSEVGDDYQREEEIKEEGELVKVLSTVEADAQVSYILLNTHSNYKPYIYLWKNDLDDNNNTVKTYSDPNGTEMNEYEQSKPGYYETAFNSSFDHFKISNGSSDVSKEVTLPVNPSTKKLYKYYVLSLNAADQTVDIEKKSENIPYVIFNYVEGTAQTEDTTGKDLPMAYAGGGKIRVKNKSYVNTYGEYQKLNANTDRGDTEKLYNDWLFGGKGGSTNSPFRVGDSMLLPYYDWYEYKIPVEQSASYSFYVTGIDPKNPSVNTKEIKNAYGDVWVSLYNNENISSNAFTNTEISTFDPDKYQIASTISLYFKMPADTSWNRNSLTISVSGVGSGGGSMEQLDRQQNIWKLDGVSKNTPFVTFTINKDGKPNIYKTRLMGGNYVLFDPLKNKPYGGWEKFESDYDLLKDACDSMLTMYYAKTIVREYDINGKSTDNSKDNVSAYLWDKLINKPDGIYNKYLNRTEGSGNPGPWMTQINPSGLAETVAYKDAQKLNILLTKMETLYTQMSLARSYISVPLQGGSYHNNNTSNARYPEYLQRGNYREYDGVSVLKDKLEDAEEAYLSTDDSSVTDSDMQKVAIENSDIWGAYSSCTESDKTMLNKIVKVDKAIESLNRAIANIKVTAEGAIAVVLYDAQNKVSLGHTFQIWYKETSNGSYKKKDVGDINPEGYPIKFITKDNGTEVYDTIYDVQFYDKTTRELLGSSKKEMNKNEAWVYMDNVTGAFWRENAMTDYRQITNDRYVQGGGDDDVKLVMNKLDSDGKPVIQPGPSTVYKQVKLKINNVEQTVDAYDTMTVYFSYDTTVIFKDPDTNANTKYTIRAGAYDFETKDVYNTSSPAYNGVFNLFSKNAMVYFGTPKNYKAYTDGTDVKSSWSVTQDGVVDFSTGNRVSTLGNVNFEMDTGSLTKLPTTRPYSFSSSGGMYFRWRSQENLSVGGAGVKLYASEYRFGAVGAIDASQFGSSMTHFYLYDYEGRNSMDITFLTDVTVKYVDSTGYLHSFVIREGDYTIEKERIKDAFGRRTNQKTEYIADLFNEDYWKALEYVKPKNSASSTKSWISGNSGLNNPEYGN